MTSRRHRVPSREIHERSTAGTSQVSKRSADRKLALHRQLGAGSSVAGRCILQIMRGPGRRGLLPGVLAQIKRRTARRHSSAPAQGNTPISAGFSRLPADRGPCVGQTGRPPGIAGGLAGSSPRTLGHRHPGASGSVNRSSCPDSVRHMSVTTAMQGHTAAHHDTQRDNSKAARKPGYAQATNRFRRWWQVLGSNQRLSRRVLQTACSDAAICH